MRTNMEQENNTWERSILGQMKRKLGEMTLGKQEKKDPENTVPTKNAIPKVNNERHARPTLLSNFILGSQDGLVNVLGILLGLTAATTDVRIFFVAALAALGAESISMGAVAYTSTSARRRVYLKEANRESLEMKDVPEIEREEVRGIFRRWGYEGDELEDLTERIVQNPKATLDLMMSYELELAPVNRFEARRSAFIVGSSTIFGSFIPLIPYLFVGKNILVGTMASVIFSGAALFCIGVYEARTTVGSLWRSGLQMAAIGLTAGLAGFLIGHFIGALPL
jgi:VIT1/CCC1 family predicted Fe2+/Mn2+ transporter